MRTLMCVGCLKDFKVKNDDPNFAYCDECEEFVNDLYRDKD